MQGCSHRPSVEVFQQAASAEELQNLMPGYTIEKILGRGGMGAVYRGVQTNLDRPVAIKILPPGVEKEDPSFAERFKSEAKLMAKLNHPAVVAVYDFGTTSAGQLYFAMEYVDGSDVSQMIAAQGKLPPEHALAITAHVCDALAAAHELGIVHRDIKPANVLLNMKGQVKVADFGLAKVEEPGSHGLTKTGYAMGTPDFVAPEALMLGTAIDGRADIYAVGVMLYQMLTGNIPRGAFKPASVLVPGLDPRFDPIILKAMQHDREERHQNAAELRRELDVIMTVPLVQQDAPVSAAIPVAQVAEVPGQRSAAQRPAGKAPQPDGRGVRQNAGAAPANTPNRTLASAPTAKSKAPLLIGLGIAAAIGIGAFVTLRSGSRETSPASNAPAKGTLTSSATKPAPAPPKPVPATPSAPVSKSPSLAASKPAEPQFPPGKWVKVFTKFEDLPDELRNPKSKRRAEWEAGWIKPALPGVQLNLAMPSTLSGNYALRASFRPGGDNVHGIFLRRQVGNNSGLYQLRLSENTLSCQRREGERYHLVSSGTAATPKAAADEFTLEFAALGSKFFGRLDSRLLCAGTDATHPAGAAGLYVNDMAVRDIEVINLDGLSEAEALKILGVDEKGNDLRQPAAVASVSPAAPAAAPISNPKSSISNAAPATFPPAQWVKMFTKPEDLPKGWKLENSRIACSADVPAALTLSKSDVANFGVKLKVIVAKAGGVTHVRLRRNNSEMYNIGLHRSGKLTAQHQTAPAGGINTSLADFDGLESIEPGKEFEMELSTVGNRIIARFRGELKCFVSDDRLKVGYASIHNELNELSDIEVINLDGLSEAEALRLLGVDEKGNDLRALAAKQEQQKAEMAQQADAIAAIPELKALHEQFVKLQGERVTAPFEAEVAKLNAGYVGGIDREIANEKKAGHLDGVIALEAEKKLIQGMGASGPQSSGGPEAPAPCPIPAEDDATTTEALKKLRGIYREAYAKLEATRAANLKALTDPLDTRLQQIEAALTQQDRIDHAKTVREYREGLGRAAGPPAAASGPAAANTPSTALGGPSAQPASKYPKGDDRKAAEWVLEMGGTVMIRESGKEITVSKLDSLPKGRFEVVEVALSRGTAKAASVDFLDALAGLDALESLTLSELPLTDDDFAILPSLPALRQLKVEYVKVTDAITPHLAACKNLERLTILYASTFEGSRLGELSRLKMDFLDLGGSGVTSAGFAAVAGWKQLRVFQAKNTVLDDAALAALLQGTDLELLLINRTKVTLAGLQALKSQRNLRHLGWNFTPGSAAHEMAEVSSVCSSLSTLELDTLEYTADDTAGASVFRNLQNMVIGNRFTRATAEGLLKLNVASVNIRSVTDLTDGVVAPLAGHRTLRSLIISSSPNLTDAVLDHFTGMKSLTKLSFTACPKITAAGVEAFKKKRPDVTVTR